MVQCDMSQATIIDSTSELLKENEYHLHLCAWLIIYRGCYQSGSSVLRNASRGFLVSQEVIVRNQPCYNVMLHISKGKCIA